MNSGPHTLREKALPTVPNPRSHLKTQLMRSTRTKKMGLKRLFRDEEHTLLFQSKPFWFLASTLGSSQSPVTLAPRGTTPLVPSGTYTYEVHIHTGTCTCKQILNEQKGRAKRRERGTEGGGGRATQRG